MRTAIMSLAAWSLRARGCRSKPVDDAHMAVREVLDRLIHGDVVRGIHEFPSISHRKPGVMRTLNRLVAGSLEKRWNDALAVQSRLEQEVAESMRQGPDALSEETKQTILALADDLPRLWDRPETSHDGKKRILRAVLEEIVVTSEGDSVRFIVHWQGGDHTELLLKKTPTGRHGQVTSTETIELITSLARLQPDERIAATINRLGHHRQRQPRFAACAQISIQRLARRGGGRLGRRQRDGQDRVGAQAGLGWRAVEIDHHAIQRRLILGSMFEQRLAQFAGDVGYRPW
jgi:hypothetical protein